MEENILQFTDAIVFKIPNIVKFEDKKLGLKVNTNLAQKQQGDLNEILQEAGINVIEVETNDNTHVSNLFADDAAIVINGIALLTRPKKPNLNISKIANVLKELTWEIIETPENEHGKTVVLEGSDVLYTNKEIFVGLRKNGTNFEGALVVARTFPDISVITIPINGKFPLKYYVSIADANVLTVSKSKESQSILRRIERDSTFRYKVLTVEHDDCLKCLNVNNYLITNADAPTIEAKINNLPHKEHWNAIVNELQKFGVPVTRFYLLIQKLKPLNKNCF